MSTFPTTRHSVVAHIRDTDEEARRLAFGTLTEGYWQPLHRYLRLQWRLSHDEAEDAAQSFFADAFQKDWLAKYDPAKARFRTFLRVCADRFVINREQAAARIKRGGSTEIVSLDDADVAARVSTGIDADDLFRREFVRALFERALDELRVECHAAGTDVLFTLFERYDIEPPDGVSYSALAQEFGLTPSQVTNGLARMRRRFRERALDTLRSLSGSDEEFRRESAELFGVIRE